MRSDAPLGKMLDVLWAPVDIVAVATVGCFEGVYVSEITQEQYRFS